MTFLLIYTKKLSNIKESLVLNLIIYNFERQSFDVNEILMEKKLILRVFELKKKICYMIQKSANKDEIIIDLSACLVEKLSGFGIIKISSKKSENQLLFH